jgi:hypothetical protein
MPLLAQRYDALRADIAARVDADLAAVDAPRAAERAPARRGLLAWLGRRAADRDAANAAGADESEVAREARIVADWQARARQAGDTVERATLRALSRAGGALLVRHGRLWGDRALLARLVTGMACNEAGGDELGRLIEPMLLEGAAREGYRLLPAQAEPVVMNTKGPSAAGKSTIRPLQRSLASRIGASWADFALISPDIWRKQLLDYAALGPDYKYGASLTGEELGVIDHKLDRYMARKAARGDMPHLLIDRFRFESFAPDSDQAGSNLLTRFGERIYLFFLITPPASLVERAWQRGLEVGRYKSVDDVLAHAVEAYGGFAELFFTWMERADKRVHFEFLDNDVPQGELPRTAAFGWNGVMNVLDVVRLTDIERFRSIDVDATAPDGLYPDAAAGTPARNIGFLAQCAARITQVRFARPDTGEVYLALRDGRIEWRNDAVLQQVAAHAPTRAALEALVAGSPARANGAGDQTRHLDARERVHTVGRWGERLGTPT